MTSVSYLGGPIVKASVEQPVPRGNPIVAASRDTQQLPQPRYGQRGPIIAVGGNSQVPVMQGDAAGVIVKTYGNDRPGKLRDWANRAAGWLSRPVIVRAGTTLEQQMDAARRTPSVVIMYKGLSPEQQWDRARRTDTMGIILDVRPLGVPARRKLRPPQSLSPGRPGQGSYRPGDPVLAKSLAGPHSSGDLENVILVASPPRPTKRARHATYSKPQDPPGENVVVASHVADYRHPDLKQLTKDLGDVALQLNSCKESHVTLKNVLTSQVAQLRSELRGQQEQLSIRNRQLDQLHLAVEGPDALAGEVKSLNGRVEALEKGDSDGSLAQMFHLVKKNSDQVAALKQEDAATFDQIVEAVNNLEDRINRIGQAVTAKNSGVMPDAMAEAINKEVCDLDDKIRRRIDTLVSLHGHRAEQAERQLEQLRVQVDKLRSSAGTHSDHAELASVVRTMNSEFQARIEDLELDRKAPKKVRKEMASLEERLSTLESARTKPSTLNPDQRLQAYLYAAVVSVAMILGWFIHSGYVAKTEQAARTKQEMLHILGDPQKAAEFEKTWNRFERLDRLEDR